MSEMLEIPDIIQLNDWEPKKFLRIMIAIQLLMLGSIGLDFMGLEIPMLRQVVGFVYLTFVPGIVILRLFRLHRLGTAQTILLSTGLSISFLMFSGFFLNSILYLLNINSPLAFWNVIIFISTLLTVLFILSFKIDRFYQYQPSPLKISRSAVYLMLLPVLSIVGTYFVNFQKNNILLMVLIVFIAMIPVLVALKKIPSELYPLAITVIAVSLLFHNSLISMYLTGWDIHGEYFFQQLVVNNAYWNEQIYSNVNAMLSIVILPTVYSYFLKMDGTWIFKIVYPIIFSMVPLGLYCVYQRLVKSDIIAFYSVFFFMSFLTFFTEMLSLARQEIAELFLVLLIFLTVQNVFDKKTLNVLLLIFAASLTTSHYGLSYIYLILLILIYLFSIDMVRTLKIRGMVLPEFNLKKSALKYFLVFYIVFLLLWYINISGSSAFKTIVLIGDNIYTSIFTELLNKETTDKNVLMAFGLWDPVVPSFERRAHQILQVITQILIIIGFFKIIIHREFSKFNAEYFYLLVGSFALLVLSILPNFANNFNMTRIYHIALFSLSPLLIIGGMFVFDNLIKLTGVKNKLKQNLVMLTLIFGILIPYFLFNTGFVYEITNDSSFSLSLGSERMKTDNIAKASYYNDYTPEQDVYSARWYYKNKNVDKIIYSDQDSKLRVLNSYGMTPLFQVNNFFINDKPRTENRLSSSYYLYLRKFNVCENKFMNVNTTDILSITNRSSEVYSNGCGEIYAK